MSAKVLMVQGCTSDAGKSLLVTALCRWARRRGLKVAPFKPQNMALNAAVTVDGGEIGRAQAVQAEAAGVAPHTDFNPILLKPHADTGAQVIVHGKAIGQMSAAEYHHYKPQAMKAVLASHQRLAEAYDLIVVEGAGSPAEINLRERDIANMGYAEAVDCPVILIADIDRGGVFAHLVGTLALLSASEQQRVAGFVINRFRGDIALLEPGLRWLEARTGKPVLGVLPFMPGLYLEAEDALPKLSDAKPQAQLQVVVPALPRISNHNDFDALRAHPQVALRFVPAGQLIPPCDLIVLPGSKATRTDLAWLHANGWKEAIAKHLRYGGKVLGICGGMQMLGQAIHDPDGLEGAAGSSAGLGYLPIDTVLQRQKRLANVRGRLHLLGKTAPVSGYEIHCGQTIPSVILRKQSAVAESQALGERPCDAAQGDPSPAPLIQLENGEHDGTVSADGQVLGSYLHGLFDTQESLSLLLQWAGLDKAQTLDLAALREASIERLADAVEKHLDTRTLQKLVEAA